MNKTISITLPSNVTFDKRLTGLINLYNKREITKHSFLSKRKSWLQKQINKKSNYNTIKKRNDLFEGLEISPDFYFVHSYWIV